MWMRHDTGNAASGQVSVLRKVVPTSRGSKKWNCVTLFRTERCFISRTPQRQHHRLTLSGARLRQLTCRKSEALE